MSINSPAAEVPASPLTLGVLNDLATNTAASTATSVAQQVSQQIANDLVTKVEQTTAEAQTTVVQTVSTLLDEHKAQIQKQITDIAAKVVQNAENDPVTERILIISVLVTFLIAGLVVLVAALLGNATANHYIVAVAALLGAPLLSIMKTGIPISQALPRAVSDKFPSKG